jgi:hypothetical protein
MNSLDYNSLEYVLGRGKLNEVTTTSAVPVVATVPSSRRTARSRPQDDDDDDDNKRHKRRSLISSTVRAVLGETHDENNAVIPDDAEKINSGDQTAQALNLKKTKENPPDPAQPMGSEEKLLTPRAALVAPDVTPQSMTEIDPSEVPNQGNTQRFKTSEMTAPPEAPPMTAPEAPTGGFNAMDILLGRSHAPQRQTGHMSGGMNPPVQSESQQPISEADAARLFSHGTSPQDSVKQGQPMPDHVPGDGKTVFESFRRFV